ncbi:hypothetical protein SLS53_002168 [Cytospora paraplurivora]|uniref:CorA-like transporter domain-containing protein n=1 Tax=Cytospora paraplurivora TaxID=2898453 RepID=A0AAN9UIA4_9PEZI
MQIAEIGRSNWHLRHCYKLHGVEISDFDQKWTVRQTAVYHSFDMQEGRAFWLTVKANEEIRERVKDGSESLEALKASNLNSLALSFISCLKTHLITLDWCVEGWRWQIGAIETGVRDVLVRVKNTPIEPLAKDLEFTPELLRLLSFKTNKGTQFPSPTRQSTMQTLNTLAGRVRVTFSARKKTVAKSEKLQVMPPHNPEADHEREEEIERQIHGLMAFSFPESQRLTSLATTLQETKLAMTLNIGVLRGLREYYEELFSSSRIPTEIALESKYCDAFNDFTRRIKSLEGHLATDCRRAETLILMIEEGKRQVSTIASLITVFRAMANDISV